jgi:hypothetical protein
MRTISDVEREINRIGLEIYEEMKSLTREQRMERANKIGEAAAPKYGFKIVHSASERKELSFQPVNLNRQSISTAIDKAAEKRDYFGASGELAEMLFSVMLRGGLRLDPWNLIRVMPAKER